MIALDTNFLIYAHRIDNPFHAIARTAIAKRLEAQQPIGVPVFCVHEFLAVTTNPRIFKEPTPAGAAFDQIEALIAMPGVSLLNPTPAHLRTLRTITHSANARGPQFHDARIAAVCLEHAVAELWTADRDFSAFTSLRTRTPQALVSFG
jgi:uncharacterized protein